MSVSQFKKQVERIGIAIISQTANLVPADRKLYALRDLTATVDSIPLIAASIMSKKIATGADILVLDVKHGSGALIKDPSNSRLLARKMIDIARGVGIKATAVLSSMDQPLGNAIGNALEIKECFTALSGEGPDDLLQLALTIAGELLILGDLAQNRQDAMTLAKNQIANGMAKQKLVDMISSQGGNSDINALAKAELIEPYQATKSGYINSIDTQLIGTAALITGAGRTKKEDQIDPAAGIILKTKIGTYVDKGDIIAQIHCNNRNQFNQACGLFDQAFTIQADKRASFQLIKEIIA